MCAECVSPGVGGVGAAGGGRGRGVTGQPPAIIGTDKPCVEECNRGEIYGNTRRGEAEWERGRKGDNEREECGGSGERIPL